MSQYGAEFDRVAQRWAVLEDEHDKQHPDRNECGGYGGCPMMRAAHDLETQMADALEVWRKRGEV